MVYYSRNYSVLSARATSGGRAVAERWRLLGYGLGGRMWSKAEIRALKKHYPDYKLLKGLLIDRTLNAIRHKAYDIGLTKRRGHVWSIGDIQLLREFYPSYPMPEVMAALPFVTKHAMRGKATNLGISRKRPLKLSGQRLYDLLRAKCKKIGYTHKDMGELVGRPHYFRTTRPRDLKLVCAAIRALDGKISPTGKLTWD